MRARILAVKVNDGGEFIELSGIADEEAMDQNPDLLAGERERVRGMYGDMIQRHGWIDVEIPDDVIRSLFVEQVDAGAVRAEVSR